SLFVMRRLPPSSTLFPYTTLFRSRGLLQKDMVLYKGEGPIQMFFPSGPIMVKIEACPIVNDPELIVPAQQIGIFCGPVDIADQRSEEHTSELQSRENLVCRLLLEK